MNATGAKFELTVSFQIRPARASDLEALEWCGTFSAHRKIIQDAFATQGRGDGVMLVADCHGFPVGQVWIDFRAEAGRCAGYIWAFRVISWMQRLGLGTHLVEAAEATIMEHRFPAAVLTIDPENTRARRFFNRMGYHAEKRRIDEYSYVTPEGERVEVRKERLLYRKELNTSGGGP